MMAAQYTDNGTQCSQTVRVYIGGTGDCKHCRDEDDRNKENLQYPLPMHGKYSMLAAIQAQQSLQEQS